MRIGESASRARRSNRPRASYMIGTGNVNDAYSYALLAGFSNIWYAFESDWLMCRQALLVIYLEIRGVSLVRVGGIDVGTLIRPSAAAQDSVTDTHPVRGAMAWTSAGRYVRGRPDTRSAT